MGRPKAEPPTTSVTLERAIRLGKLLKSIAKTARTRAELMAKLKVDLRGFYRDVKTIRSLGISVSSDRDLYRLTDDLNEARGKLPCPDPLLTVAELRAVSKGTTDTHKKLRRLLDAVAGPSFSANGKH